MKVPALAAKPPAGATHTIVGTFAPSIAVTICCVESRLPPGVSSRITTAAAPDVAAAWRPLTIVSVITASTSPVAGRTTTAPGLAARIGNTASSRPARDRRPATTNRR